MIAPGVVDHDHLAVQSRIERCSALTRQGRTAGEIAASLGVTTRSVQRYRLAAGVSQGPSVFRWTPGADRVAQRMIRAGETRVAVSRILGCSNTAVHRRYPRESGLT